MNRDAMYMTSAGLEAGGVVGSVLHRRLLNAAIFALILAVVLFMWWRGRKGRKRADRTLGAKTRALLAALVRKARDAARPRPVLRPVPGGAAGVPGGPAVTADRLAELMAENTALRAELAAIREQATRKQAKSGYQARRLALKAQGRWQPYTEAGPVQEHIRSVLAATGMSCRQFAAVAGASEDEVRAVVKGRRQRLLRTFAAKLLSVTADVPLPGSGWVPAAGPSRRLQALGYAGWPVLVLAKRLGMDKGQVRVIRDGGRQKVSIATARKVRDLYDQIWNVPPPEGTSGERIAAAKTRAYAVENGFVPAGAWDDDLIDDPASSPAEAWQRPERKTRPRAELVAEAAELAGFGLDRGQQAERLGVSREALDRALARARVAS